jgi:hypothetical protein
MKKLCTVLAVAGALALAGCNTSPPGGGSARNTAGGSGSSGSKASEFKLHAPENITNHEVKHGSPESYTVTVDRGKEFKEDIAFTATTDPAHADLKVDVDPKTLKGSDPGKVMVKVTAGDKVPTGKYTLTVTATPKVGSPTSVHWDLKVPEKK